MRNRGIESRHNTKNQLHLGYNFVVEKQGIVHKVVFVKHCYGVDLVIQYSMLNTEIKRCPNTAHAQTILGELLLDSPGLHLHIEDCGVGAGVQDGDELEWLDLAK